MSIRVPQAMSTNRALAATGEGTTAVSARFAGPDGAEGDEAMSTNRAPAATGGGAAAVRARFAVAGGVEAEDATGGREGESGRLIPTAPTVIRHAAAAAAAPTARRCRARSRLTAP